MATKTYEIKINGVVENIDAVKALNEQLKEAESRIKAINAKGFSSIKGGGGGKSELSEQERIEKQIAKNEEKIAAARTEQAKALQMQKDILKEINKEQKGQVAEGRLSKGGYSNTMAGLKSELADIKAVMNHTDLGDSAFKDLVARANELTTKLKEIEASYGTFGRNVGNYANGVAEGIVHARQELKGLKTEMQDLANKKRKGIITQDEEERLKSVVKEYNNLKSTLEDANKPMDEMMDTVQSIVAIVSAGKGIASFFGLDGNKVEESLKKLLALQNAMQGLQTIQKQMSAGDGLGKYFASMNSSIDTGTQKLLVYNRAILGTGKAAKITAVSIKALGTALKSIGIGLVIAGIVQLLDLLDKWLNKSKEVSATMQTINDIVGQTGQGYAKANINIKMAQKAIDNFNGSAKEEKKLLDQLNSSTNGLVANCKNLDEAKQKIVEHSDEYIEMMKLEAQAQALLTLYTSEYAKLIQTQQIFGQQFSGNTFLNDSFDNVMQRKFDQLDNLLEKATGLQNKASDLRNSLFTNEDEKKNKNINQNNNKTLDAVKRAQENINELTLKLMSDGLYKELRKLDENNRREIDKIKKNGEKVEEQLKLQYKAYEKDKKELFDRYINDIEKSNVSLTLQNEIDQVKSLREEWNTAYLVMNRPTSTKDAPLFGISDRPEDVEKLIEQYKSWVQLYDLRNDELSKQNWKAYFEALKKDYLPKAAKEIQDEFYRLLEAERPDSFDGLIEGDLLVTGKNQKQAYNYLREAFEKETSDLKYFLTKYQGTVQIGEKEISQILEDSYLERVSLTTNRFRNHLDIENNYINESLRLEKERIDKEEKLEKEANETRLKNAREDYEKLIKESQKYSASTSLSVAELLRGREESGLTDEEKSLQKFVKLIDEYEKEATQITKKYATQRKNAELDATIQRRNNNYKYYEQTITNFEDYIQKASNIIDKQPEVNEFGFINLKKTREQYKEVLDMYKHMADDIKATAMELLQDFTRRDISGEQFDAAMNNLEFYKKKVEENLEDIKERIKQHQIDFLSTINNWLQQVGQATTSIMSSLSEITSNGYEKQIDAMEKYIDKLSDLYDIQRDKTQEYADAVNDIENELSDARGDRRQQLIDQLNAEMAAQRASLEQEKRLEKEKEKADHRKEELEYQQAVARKRMDEAQALINSIMAVSMAAVNHYPIPAIPMMSLAAAVGAAQYAAVRSQYIPRPTYGDGGVIVGKSHKDGGVPVLGGRAEVEGGEFITNKVTTSKNADLLEFINSKRKKVDISDLIDFYGSGKPSKSIKGIRTKFADGGSLPLLRNDISMNDRVLQAIEDYSNRPTVVQVVDIVNQTERLNQVKVISGLEV